MSLVRHRWSSNLFPTHRCRKIQVQFAILPCDSQKHQIPPKTSNNTNVIQIAMWTMSNQHLYSKGYSFGMLHCWNNPRWIPIVLSFALALPHWHHRHRIASSASDPAAKGTGGCAGPVPCSTWLSLEWDRRSVYLLESDLLRKKPCDQTGIARWLPTNITAWVHRKFAAAFRVAWVVQSANLTAWVDWKAASSFKVVCVVQPANLTAWVNWKDAKAGTGWMCRTTSWRHCPSRLESCKLFQSCMCRPTS